MIGFEPGYEARVVADDVTFTLPEYLLQAALDASYAAKDHTHTADQISGLEGALGSYLTKTDAANTYQTRLSGAAGADDVGDTDRFIWKKTSDSSILTTSWWNIKDKLRAYFETLFAKVIHSHSIAEVGGLQDQLNSKITTDGRAYPRRIGGANLNFHWSGQGGQPSWLWGGNEPGTDMFVYNPSNFSVNYANSSNYANSAGTAGNVGGWTAQGFYDRIEDRSYWRTRDYLLAEHVPVGGFALLTCEDGGGAGGTVSGTRVYWSSATGVTPNGNTRVNYGTWQKCGGTTGSAGAAATTVCKRIG